MKSEPKTQEEVPLYTWELDFMDITIDTTVEGPIEKVWTAWTEPRHIVQWNFASQDWQCPRAEIDLTVGGKFTYRMEAKDGSMGFDFEGTFTAIDPGVQIEYALSDDRRVTVRFVESGGGVTVVETFEADDTLPFEQQRQGWQSILNNFKKHVETGGL